MHFKGLDLNLLVVLDTLLTLGSVTRAAKHLNVSQPAISHALSRLRIALDDPLFVRAQGRMEPTTKALRLQLPLREALDSLGDLLAGHTQFIPEKLDETIFIGATDYSDFVLVPMITEALYKKAPMLKIIIRSVGANSLNQHLSSGEVDMAIVFSAASMPGIYEEALLEDEYVCLGHQAMKGRLTLERYLKESHAQVSHRASLDAVPDLFLKQRGLSRRVVFSTPHFMAAASVAARSGLLMTTPHRVGRHLAKEFPLKVYTVPFELPPIELKLVWHSRTESDPTHVWIRDVVREVAATIAQRDLESLR